MDFGRTLSLAAIAGLAVAVQAAPAAVLASYSFSQSSLGPTASAANVTGSNVSFGSSVTAPIFTNDYWASKPVITIARTNDTAAQVYLQATITAAPGYELDLDSFTFDGARGGASGPRTYEVHSSVAGLLNDASTAPTSTSLKSGTFDAARGASGATDTLPTITTDLTAAAYDHLSTLTMRVYFYTPTTGQNIDVDNLVFNGTVSAVPEPATLAAGAAAVLALAGRRRRRA